MALPVVTLYTDGGYSRTHNHGAWAAYFQYGTQDMMMCQCIEDTTNNSMEMLGVIRALQQLQEPCEVHLYSDSQYVIKGIGEWLKNWKRRNWRTSTGKPVLNVDLWQELDNLLSQHVVHPHWVRGHNGNPDNELCDQLATCVQRYPW